MRTVLRPFLFGCLIQPLLAHAQIDCQPFFATAGINGHYIDGLQLGGIDYSGSGASDIPGYENWCYFNAQYHAALTPGATTDAMITAGPNSLNDQYAIWVDMDRNQHFEGSELVGYGVCLAPVNGLTTVSVAIPDTAKPGYTTMRVLCVNGEFPFDPCGFYGAGEAEDYTVVIEDGAVCMPHFWAQGSGGDYVAAVALNDLSWTVPTAPPVWGYEDRTDFGTHLEGGVTYQLTVTKGNYDGPNEVYAWVDWYNNGFTSDDLVGTQVATGPGGTVTFDITPPPDFPGYARMRVASTDGGFSNNDPCGSTIFGHAVDLSLSIGHQGWPCLPLMGAGTAFGDGIDSLTLFGASYAVMQHYPYVDGTDDRFRFDAGYSGILHVVGGAYVTENYNLWMDINDNGYFGDPGELLGSVQNSVPHEHLDLHFTVPADCVPGQHFMRLRSNDNGIELTDGCSDTYYGSIFDMIAVVELPQGPCVPALDDWTLHGHFIDGVQLGTLQNTNSGAAWGPAYSTYALSTDLTIAVPQTMSIYGGATEGDDYAAWIDLNDDHDFEDANELLGTVNIPTSFAPAYVYFQVPNGTALGQKRMRVRCMPPGTGDPCADAGYGETEDYLVMIVQNTGVDEHGTAMVEVLTTDDGVVLVADATAIGAEYTVHDPTGRVLTKGLLTSDRTAVNMLGYAMGSYFIDVRKGAARTTKHVIR